MMLSLFTAQLILQVCSSKIGHFNFSEYEDWVVRLGKGAFPPLPAMQAYEWHLDHMVPGVGEGVYDQNEAKMLFSKMPKKCPIPYDGVPIWYPPQHAASSQKCWNTLNQTKQALLAAMEQVSEYPPITGFFHISVNVSRYLTQDRNDAIFELQIQKLQLSKLLDNAKLVVRIGLIDEDVNHFRTTCVKHLVETRIRNWATDVEIQYVNAKDYECNTIQYLQSWCGNNENSFVFYLHNKGYTHKRKGALTYNVRDWREYMMFFLFERWRLCANSLTHGAAACGVAQRAVKNDAILV